MSERLMRSASKPETYSLIPTWIGVLLFLIGGVLLFRGGVLDMFAFVLFTAPLGGAAALLLPALGGSSVPPTYLALGFLVARILLAGRGSVGLVGQGLKDNAPFAIYCLYGAITAFILPRMFAGEMYVTPMRFLSLRHLFDVSPLKFSNQNITAAVYLIGTLLGAVLASAIARKPGSGAPILRSFIVLSWLNVGLAVLALILAAAKLQFIIDIFRNGSYAQLDTQYNGMIRITGLFPEASVYAAFSFVLVILMMEAWLRDLMPRRTGPAALALAITLVFSTSSTAYLSLAAYTAILMLRWMIFPHTLTASKAVKLWAFIFLGVFIVLLLAVASPKVMAQFTEMLQHMTVEKASSASGRQRRFWAEQGLQAFRTSFGLGIGAGSFRSSSLATSIAGSVGVLGIVAFVAYVLNVLKPMRASTYEPGVTGDWAMGACCGWAAVIGLIPAIVGAASPDPGLMFAMLAGLAVTWRIANPSAAKTSSRASFELQTRARPPTVLGAG